MYLGNPSGFIRRVLGPYASVFFRKEPEPEPKPAAKAKAPEREMVRSAPVAFTPAPAPSPVKPPLVADGAVAAARACADAEIGVGAFPDEQAAAIRAGWIEAFLADLQQPGGGAVARYQQGRTARAATFAASRDASGRFTPAGQAPSQARIFSLLARDQVGRQVLTAKERAARERGDTATAREAASALLGSEAMSEDRRAKLLKGSAAGDRILSQEQARR